MSCIVSEPSILGEKKRLVIKGASEIVLESCSKIHSLNDEICEITPELRTKISDAIDKMASQALRTLILAYRDLDPSEGFFCFYCFYENLIFFKNYLADLKEKDAKGVYLVEKSNLIFFGLIGIKDILRKEVPQAIATCKKAGIKVCMITGDNKITARAIGNLIFCFNFIHIYLI